MKTGAMIRWDLMLIPLATEHVLKHKSDGYYGYTFVYIFGLRIAKIHGTKPWEKLDI